VDFDFALMAKKQHRMVGYFGFAVRPDTGFAELIAVATDPAEQGVIRASLAEAVRQSIEAKSVLLAAKAVSTKAATAELLQSGFKKTGEEVMLVKKP